MSKPRVLVFASPLAGHFTPVYPVVAGLAARRIAVEVFTGKSFAASVRGAGAGFVDLFDRHPLAEADDESLPVVSRYVTYAAHYAQEVIRSARELRPSLIVCDTFAVIGRVVATALELPWVNVSPGHDLDPERFVARLLRDPRVALSARCLEAVELLRERYGITDASPFSYVTGLSPFLNLLPEPEQWLTAQQRRVFEPSACFGCLPPARELEPVSDDSRESYFPPVELKVYASFGTVAWWYWPERALAALEAVTDAVHALGERAAAVIALGEAPLAREQIGRLRGKRVIALERADQWLALRDADLFVTSHGVNSTHEAIYRRVPMISYPFFWDQPALAERCAELGLAVPLADGPRAPVEARDVVAAVASARDRTESMSAALERARAWELEAITGREAVLDQIEGLIELAPSGRATP